MGNEIMVSVSCITYNHEQYIADAIESFLMQKTNFPYEILIHDDASKDRTPAIIKEYEAKYPDLIKPIYQTENQYSKGVKVGRFNRERAQGKYIALCEGDDYWTDPLKLQKQVEYMQSHPECSLCVHAAYQVSSDKSRLDVDYRPNEANKVYTVDEVITGGGGLFATNSMLFPAVFGNSLSKFQQNVIASDYPLAIYLALQGEVFYIDEFMSAHRSNVPGSFTSILASSLDNRALHCKRTVAMLDELNKYTDFKYDIIIKKTKQANDIKLFNVMLEQGLFKEAKQGQLKYIYADLDLIAKIKIFMRQYCPGMVKMLVNIKRNLAR